MRRFFSFLILITYLICTYYSQIKHIILLIIISMVYTYLINKYVNVKNSRKMYYFHIYNKKSRKTRSNYNMENYMMMTYNIILFIY